MAAFTGPSWTRWPVVKPWVSQLFASVSVSSAPAAVLTMFSVPPPVTRVCTETRPPETMVVPPSVAMAMLTSAVGALVSRIV